MPLPDEGLIHAWLDGQLPPGEAERVERLVATDPAWAAAAAEARGLVAASSRILAALDDVPRGVLPMGGSVARSTRRMPWWTKAAAAIVVIVGGSTLVLQRAPAPTVAEMPRATVPAATPTETAPVTAVVTPQGHAEERKPQAKATSPARADASTRARAEVVAPAPASVPPTPQVQAVGGVLSGNVGGAPAQRVAEQGVQDQRAAMQRAVTQRAVEQQAGAQRDAAAPAMARMASPLMASKSATALTGVVVTGVTASSTVAIGACYAMRDSRDSTATGIVMRGERQVADTLFLAPLRPSLPARGWIVARDGVLRGVLTTETAGRGMLLVTATVVPCTAP
ncbi:MAG: hypothetical protein ACYC3L_03055 [Gemmatimonadaceae bacterium]